MSKKTISDALKAFSERYYTLRLPAPAINEFGVALDKYIQKVKKAIDANASEETIKNIVNRFLVKNFYSETEFEVNAHGSIDSAIIQDDNLLALIETKRPVNSNEMVRENDLNKKALWELTFYYLSETRDVSGSKVRRVKDVEIRRLIITDSIQWLLIDSTDLEKICDGYLEKLYFKYKNGQLTYANDNPKFYEDIKSHFEKISITKCLDYLWLDFESMYKQKKNWQYIYKVLQREFLLKFGYKQEVKAHVLNERFYQELLYIMGLRETKENNTTLIKIDSGIENSFAAQVFKKYVDDKDFPEEKAIDRAFELIIIWINRLLFIKLFEGQLVAFNSNEDCYHILDNNKIKDFQNLQDLFFNVLGKKKREESGFYNQFAQIPYLNSSLFERQAIEARDININELKNEPVIKKPHSILGSKGSKSVPLLEYIINFLNSYSFSAQAADSDGLSVQRQEIIDAAVLGLIFEKLNGYKDGSHYTPSIITEYMCKDVLELVVLRKINKELGWDCKTLAEAKDRIGFSLDTAKKVNSLINTIRIADPAVGSGHFLVSMLNRLIAIKKELNTLFKYNSDERLHECNIVVTDDVLRILDGQGNDFVYDKSNHLSQQIQQTIFNEKRLLIEDCLFGVDLNVKAVSICNLRLWVELLKSAYYHEGVMETLPNIDINIKCGNSLISRLNFEPGKKIGARDTSLDKREKQVLKEYKRQVKLYKSASEKSEKTAIVESINRLKNDLHRSYEQLSLYETMSSVSYDTYENAFEWAFEFPEILSEDGVFLGFDCVIGNPPYVQLQTMSDEADKLKSMGYRSYARMGDIYCLFYEQGYKLLNDSGILSFITSNKWMRAGYGEALRTFFAEKTNPITLIDFAGHKIFDSATVDVNIMTLEKGENQGETESCIIKDDCLDNLSVYIKHNSVANRFCSNDSWTILSPIEQSIKRKIEAAGVPLKEWDIRINYGIKTGLNEAFIIDRAKRDELISADPKSAEIIRPILRGRDIKKYICTFADLWLINTHNGVTEKGIAPVDIKNYTVVKEHLDNYYAALAKRLDKGNTPYNLRSCAYTDDFSKQKIIWGELSDEPKFAFDEDGQFVPNNTIFLMVGSHLKYLLAFLNSKTSKFYFSKIATTSGVGTTRWLKYKIETLPIPKLNIDEQIPFIEIVDKLLHPRENAFNESALEENLARMIYGLFGFSDEEIQAIET